MQHGSWITDMPTKLKKRNRLIIFGKEEHWCQYGITPKMMTWSNNTRAAMSSVCCRVFLWSDALWQILAWASGRDLIGWDHPFIEYNLHSSYKAPVQSPNVNPLSCSKPWNTLHCTFFMPFMNDYISLSHYLAYKPDWDLLSHPVLWSYLLLPT